MAWLFKRGGVYYIRYSINGKRRRVTTKTSVLQVAKEKLRRFEDALARGDESPLPRKSSIGSVISAYARHIRAVKTPKSAQTDLYYLREAFGPVCDELVDIGRRERKPKASAKKPPGADRRQRVQTISAPCFEAITTAQVAAFISSMKATRGHAPKTANRYREILIRLFNWSMTQHGIRMPGDRNPAARVERYREAAPEIRFLTLAQITQQLAALEHKPKLQTMTAVLIYAGLRREEMLWLTHEDMDLNAGQHGMIRVRAKTIDGEAWQPKTKVNRAVPVSSTLRGYLDRWRAMHPKGTWLFPSPDGHRWDPDNFSHDLRDANAKAGLVWSALDFRHTFGSQLAQKGESLFKIATLMGNSPEICRRHYAALIPESLIDSVEFSSASSAVLPPPKPTSDLAQNAPAA